MSYAKIYPVCLGFIVYTNHSAGGFDSSFEIKEEMFTVSTPARLEQRKKNVPGGVTIIDADRISELGISNLAESLRLVPGMRITQASGWDYRVGFHGTNGLIPRRMLLRINGVSSLRYGFAEIDWMLLPIDVLDVEKSEDTRNPSSASFGSNAFQNVINIKTLNPRDADSIYYHSEVGSNRAYKNYGRLAGEFFDTAISLSLSEQGDDGFDYVKFDDPEKPDTPGATDDHDVQRIFLSTDTTLNKAGNFIFNVGGVKSKVEDEEVDPNQLAPPDRRQEDWHILGVLNQTIGANHKLKLLASFQNEDFKESWWACNPTAAFVTELRDLSDINSTLAWQLIRGETPTPEGEEESRLLNIAVTKFQELGAELTTPICGLGNQDHETQKRLIEIEDTISIGNQLRVNTGIGYEHNSITSETYTNGKTGSTHTHLFSNAEYIPTDYLTVNAGFMYEKVSTVDNDAFSPRLGLNFHFNLSHTIRFVYSTGKRFSNILETNRWWTYLVRYWDHEFDGRSEGKFFLTTRSPDGLKPESIESFEIGIRGWVSKHRIEYDARIFKENLRDLISEKGRFFDYNLTNENYVDMEGFEAEFTYRFSPRFELNAGYSYLDMTTSNFFEDTLHSDHQGFASLIYRNNSKSIALAHYSNSPIAGESYDRTDLVIKGESSITETLDLNLRFKASYFGHDETGYQFRTTDRAVSSYFDATSFTFSIGISY